MPHFWRSAIATLVGLALIGGPQARADSSCDVFFANLRAAAAKTADSYVHTLWTTNYFIPDRSARFMATTELQLRPLSGDLFGAATRNQVAYAQSDRQAPVSDAVSIRLRADGKIMFNEQYGPFDPVCAHERFASVVGGDSFEVFSFKPGTDTARNLELGDRMTVVQPTQPLNTGPRFVEPWEPVQWNVANTDKVYANTEFQLHNTRRRSLNLTSQLGTARSYDLLWAGTSGGHFVFVRPNRNDQREISDLEVVALYNTRNKRYLKGQVQAYSDRDVRVWSAQPVYEWMVLNASGPDFALFNIHANDFLVLAEVNTNPAREQFYFLTYLACAMQYGDSRGCAQTYKRPPG